MNTGTMTDTRPRLICLRHSNVMLTHAIEVMRDVNIVIAEGLQWIRQ